MATALSQSEARNPSRRFETLFEREVRPRLGRLEETRAAHQRRCLRILGCGAVGTGMAFGLLFAASPGYALFGTLLAAAISGALALHVRRQYLGEVRRVVMPVICEAIGDLAHRTGDAPDLDFGRIESLGLLPSHDRRRLDDVFSGRHRNTLFTMAEVRLTRRSSRRRGTRTVFRGLVLAIGAPREVPARILIARDAGRLGNRIAGWLRGFKGLHRVPVPHAAFERHFALYAERPETALETVTPGVAEALAGLAEAHGGRPIQAAFDGRWFHLAMPRKGDLFRLGALFEPAHALERQAEAVLHDVQIVHRVIDHLHGERVPLA